MKKLVSLILTISLLVVGFTTVGCKKRPQGTVGDAFDVNIQLDKNVKADLKVSCSASLQEMDIITGLGEAFKEIYPNVTVTPEPIGGSNAISVIMGWYQSNSLPDIMQLSSFEMLNLVPAEVLLNLDPYIKAEEANGTFNHNDYYEAYWKVGQADFNGAQYLIPRSADSVVCQVNKKILREAGVDLNPETTLVKNGWTWEDFLTVCAQVKQKYPNRGIVDSFYNWEAVFNPIFMSYGAKYFENGIAAVDNDGIRNGLLLIEDMVKKGYQGTSNSLQANFAGGQGAFMFHSQALSIGKMNIDASYAREYPNGVDESVFDVVTFPIINEENPCIGAGIAGYALSSTTKNRDVAWQFLKFMLTKQGQNIIAEKGKTNYPPIRKDMSDVNDETNLWTKGYSNFNLEAYLWAAENDALCMTDFILEAPQYATDLISAIQTLISDYVVVEDPIDEAISSCNKKLNYWLNN